MLLFLSLKRSRFVTFSISFLKRFGYNCVTKFNSILNIPDEGFDETLYCYFAKQLNKRSERLFCEIFRLFLIC
jgi:hypothetical protein